MEPVAHREERNGVDGGPLVVRGERNGDLKGAEALADDLRRVLDCADFSREEPEDNKGAERGKT